MTSPINHSLSQMRETAGESVTLRGNIPPRDVLALGTPDDVKQSVADALADIDDHRRILLSVGGGTSPETPTANIEAFCDAVK